MKPLRIYLDTSVFGGCFDKEFAKESFKIFEAIRLGRLRIVLGELVGFELKTAPREIRDLLESLPPENVEEVKFSREAEELRDSYLDAGILTPNSRTDAGHVATATVYRADAIVSWNFKHIVQLEKMKLYNQINLKNGYGFLQIVSPREVLSDE
jgi:predicted nucleic acid-binding protein